MKNMQDAAEFFKEVSASVLNLAENFARRPAIAKQKGRRGDYATELDIAVEELIVSKIKVRFPGDEILAEEAHSDTAIGAGRIWIIDPICGTNNLGRGIKAYCTNIALAENRELIASCVVDHACKDVVWSVGEGVHVNDGMLELVSKDLGVTIDVDLNSLNNCSDQVKTKHFSFVKSVSLETDYMLTGSASSISFLYTATGKLDGFTNPSTHPWDICAGVFLIQQAGGTVTDFDGNPWNVDTVGTLAAGDKNVHARLLELHKSA